MKMHMSVRRRMGDEYKNEDEDDNENGKRKMENGKRKMKTRVGLSDTLSDTLLFTLTILRY